MVCKTIKPNYSRVCTNDLAHKISVQFTSSKGTNNPDQNAGASFHEVVEVWAMIKTSPAFNPFSGININPGVNTDFYIRYDSRIDLNKQIWVEYNGSRFKVTAIENIDKKDHFIRLRATERGIETLGAAQR